MRYLYKLPDLIANISLILSFNIIYLQFFLWGGGGLTCMVSSQLVLSFPKTQSSQMLSSIFFIATNNVSNDIITTWRHAFSSNTKPSSISKLNDVCV